MLPFLTRALLLFAAGAGGLVVGPQEAPSPAQAGDDGESTNVSAELTPLQVDTRRAETLFEGALTGAKDAEDFAETPGYRRLLEIVADYGEEEIREKAKRPLDVQAALAAPSEWRGELTHLRGLVAGRRTVRLSDPIGSYVDIYRAVVTQADGTEGVIVDFLRPPPEIELQRDVVDVEGVFYRTVRYENKKGVVVEAPYLIARGLRLLDLEDVPKHTVLDGRSMLFIAVAGAFLLARVVLSMRQKKSGAKRRDLEAARAARMIRERAEASLKAAHTTPKGTPDSST